jgi:hypothetical protein
MKMLHRRNLPHLYFNEGNYFITYRLANSIPSAKLAEIKTKKTINNFRQFKRLFEKYDNLLDSGEFGINYLAKKEITEVCKVTLHYPDSRDYKLICYCIMPNHIHLVFELLQGNKGISKIMQSIKRISSRKCNMFLGREGKFWQDVAKRSLCEELRYKDT